MKTLEHIFKRPAFDTPSASAAAAACLRSSPRFRCGEPLLPPPPPLNTHTHTHTPARPLPCLKHILEQALPRLKHILKHAPALSDRRPRSQTSIQHIACSVRAIRQASALFRSHAARGPAFDRKLRPCAGSHRANLSRPPAAPRCLLASGLSARALPSFRVFPSPLRRTERGERAGQTAVCQAPSRS